MTTLEGLPAWYAAQKKLAVAPALHPVQQAMVEEQAVQCGYCFNGMIVKASELLSKNARPIRRADPDRDERAICAGAGRIRGLSRGQAGVASDGGWRTMNSRRDFLKAGGALVIGFSLRCVISAQDHSGTVAGPPDAKQIDTWLAIHSDNTATVYIGFAELGQGNSTALLQIAADELDMDMSQVKTVRLDTNITPNQGGTYSSASIQRGGPQVRTAAAEARAALLKMASAKLERRSERLTISKGIVSVEGNRTRGQLRRADR